MTRKISRADIQHLHDLGKMKDRGILTAEEFADQKAIVLSQDEREQQRSVPFATGRLTFWTSALAAALIIVAVTLGVFGDRSAAHQVDRSAVASSK
jgi:hypothetical protein